MLYSRTYGACILLVISFMTSVLCCQPNDNEIQQAVNNQLEMYPESTLQDIYKSFFQDEFGPGHLLDDTDAARKYLKYELSQMVSKGNYEAELCGTGRNFFRVPLDLVKDGKISKEKFLDAFVKSAASFKVPNIDDWRDKWEKIVTEIETMDLKIRNFNEDKRALSEMLNRGEAVAHHSKIYSERYTPHYRIISRDLLPITIPDNK